MQRARKIVPRRMKRISAFAVLLATCLYNPTPTAEAAILPSPIFMDGDFFMEVESYAERKFRSIVRQEYDFSCGSAALATLLTHHYDRKINEARILQSMFLSGDQEKILKQGFSLLDMKNYLASIGLSSNGYKLTLEKLESGGVPSIALLNIKGYLHFVVVKGISGDEVLIGDPSAGMRTMSKEEFKKAWNGVAFVITEEVKEAKDTFNRRSEWAQNTKARINNMQLEDFLSHLTMHMDITSGYIHY